MATSAQMKSLVKSHADGDDMRFYATALQIASRAARAGQTKFANELRDLVESSQKSVASDPRNVASVVPLHNSVTEGASLFEQREANFRLRDLILDEKNRQQLLDLVFEQVQSHRLAAYGLSPCKRLLLLGEPGTGKTTTAQALARELQLPFYVLKLDVLITRFMGETATKLRLAFEFISAHRGVYLFDEVDALAGERSLMNDVGEMRRVLNSFLQFLEQDSSSSVIVAASNHPRLLDKAFFRRFDKVIAYHYPSESEGLELLKRQLLEFDTSSVDWNVIVPKLRGLSQADICSIARESAKKAVLSSHGVVTTSQLKRSFSDSRDYLEEFGVC